MKGIHFFIAAMLMTVAACEAPHTGTDPDKPQKGIVSGRVTDSQGKPVANAEIVASNLSHYNTVATGFTDANGNYSFKVATGISEGYYSVEGYITIKYQGKNYKLALYNENTREFVASDGAVRNFQFRLTGKRNVDADESSSPLGGKLEVWNDPDNLVRENIEVTLEPDGPLVDGSAGSKIVAKLPKNGYYLEDVPVGKYKITAKDVSTDQKLGISVMDSFQPYTRSVTGLFVDDDFVGSTHFRLAVNIGLLQ